MSPRTNGDRRARRVLEDCLVMGVVPDIPTSALIAVGRGVAALARVDPNALAGSEPEGAELVDVVGGVTQCPTGEPLRDAAVVGDTNPFGVKACVAACVAPRRVVLDGSDADC